MYRAYNRPLQSEIIIAISGGTPLTGNSLISLQPIRKTNKSR